MALTTMLPARILALVSFLQTPGGTAGKQYHHRFSQRWGSRARLGDL